MSIQNTVRIISRVIAIGDSIKTKYIDKKEVASEIGKLNGSLKDLADYLNKLDEMQPNNTTNDINKFMTAIDLHMDILKIELEQEDYTKLKKGLNVIQTGLKFHPTKYSFIEFIIMWVYEFIYFI